MHKPPADLLAFSILLLCCVLLVWTGIAGPIFADSFWVGLEKWQTLLAAILALIAAYFAARPVYRQLEEQRRQSAAAAVTVIVKAAVALEGERDRVRVVSDDLYRLNGLLHEYDNGSLHDIYASWPNAAFDQMDVCDAALRDMRRYSQRNPDLSTTQHARLHAIAALQAVRTSLTDLVTIMRQNTSGLNYEDGEADIPEQEHDERRNVMDVNLAKWKAAAAHLDDVISDEISGVWRRIRHLERIAVGHSLSRQ
jgi:membrane protein implicated in regulation of membrane protease activity